MMSKISGKSNRQAAESFKNAVTATVRAMAGDGEIEVSFGAEKPNPEGHKARLPMVFSDMSEGDLAKLRGHGDAFSLNRRYHNTKTHGKFLPNGEMAQTVYNAIEQARVEAIGSLAMEGVAKNLDATIEEFYSNSRLQVTNSPEEAALGDIMKLMVRERLTHQAPPQCARLAIDAMKNHVESAAGIHLDDLLTHLSDQEAYSRLSRKIISDLELADDLTADDTANSSQEDADENSDDNLSNDAPDEGDEAPEEADENDEGESSSDSGDGDSASGGDSSVEMTPEQLAEMLGDAASDQAAAPWGPSNLSTEQILGPHYRIFTREFDELITAEELCDPEELVYLRANMDKQLSAFGGMITKLANRLQRMLMAQQMRSWDFDLEEGILDSARLTRVVTNPAHALSFKRENETDFKDTVVTLLIDNSGSMRGQPITTAALCTDILTRTLERCGVRVEVLGFTTKTWKGGKSRAQWIEGHKEKSPGRLNDIRHIIYKTADTPWRRTKNNLALMLREGLLKENIDGEALLWAHSRIVMRPEERRILMVISDGAPVDDSTLSTNNANYLEDHLRQVIHWIEKKSPVELLAIGIGHDVTRYYSNAITIADVEQLGTAITDKLADLFEI
jgi:cobaltochelatase CobT